MRIPPHQVKTPLKLGILKSNDSGDSFALRAERR
jgi:hypothetical protein